MVNCNIWKSTNAQWNKSEWKWSDCGYRCPIWSLTSKKWNIIDHKWKDCIAIPEPPIPSGEINLSRIGVDATTLIQPWLINEPWNPYKNNDTYQKRLIKLIFKMNGLEYKAEHEKKPLKEPLKVIVKNVDILPIKSTNINVNIL